jgi:hypothetical protein
MKANLKIYSTLLLITILAVSGKTFAGEDPVVEKKKTYSKSYTVSSSDKVSFENQFGELKINTWDKNEVKVDITITAEAGTDEKAQRIIDRISIQDSKGSNGVSFKTKIENNDKQDKWEKGEKQHFSIDYIVYMPARNTLHAENSFGAMIIGDYSGEATVISKFGTLTAGKLTNTKKVSVEFGKANIASISDGELVVKFSNADIANMEGAINASFEYSGATRLKVDNDVKSLTVKNNFSHLYLDLSTNLSANFDINCNFGDVSNKSNFAIKEEGEDDNKRGPNFNNKFSGKAGGGNMPIRIKSEFGEITLGHNIKIDIDKEDNDNRNRNKNDNDNDNDNDNGKGKNKDKHKDKKRTTRI